MKFSKLSQLFLVSTIGLLVATFLTACQLVTIDYVFVGDSAGVSAGSSGQIETFAVDAHSGALRVIAPTVASGGVKPVSMAVSGNYYHLYVANAASKNVVHFTIASSGVLTKADSISLPDTPVAVAVSAASDFLYVTYGSSSATLAEYPLSTSGAIGALTSQQTLKVPAYPADTIIPTGVALIPNNNNVTAPPANKVVYVSAYNASAYNPGGTPTSNANPGWVFGFVIGSNGTLTPTAGSPYQAGVKPAGITADPVSRFLYVTDFASNQLIGYSIQTNGSLNFLLNGPFRTGNQPSAIAVDPRGLYIYLSNTLDSTISGYTISAQNGSPSAIVGTGSTTVFATDTQPVAIGIEPALARFIYTANYLGNSVSGFRFDPNNGSVTPTQATPYPTGANPAALAIVPHGNHSLQSITP
jgi:6-phosphogluconolactonase (cycloisomerase 2 family)